jgi:Heterokaryon incompatibility protein (HET)
MPKPSEPDQLMIFDLEVYSLDQGRPEYVALSYTWGHPVWNDFKDDLSHTIVCNGHHVPIGLNLYEALHYLFIESDIAPRLIWIDAICIDQSNVEERGAQVKQMTSVYLHATRVIIWLGAEDQDAKEASGFFNEYTPVLRKLLLAGDPTSTLQANLHNVYDDLTFHQKHNTTPRDLDKWKSLMRFFSRRWFWRVWVVQELAYAQSKIICCGSLRFDWSDMDVFVACVFGAQWCGFNLADELKEEILDIANVFTLHREISMMAGGRDDPTASMQLGLNERIYLFAE